MRDPADWEGEDVRDIQELFASLRAEGYAIISEEHTDPASGTRVFILERTNSWTAHIFGILIGTIAGGLNPSRRHERLLVIAKGPLAIVRPYV